VPDGERESPSGAVQRRDSASEGPSVGTSAPNCPVPTGRDAHLDRGGSAGDAPTGALSASQLAAVRELLAAHVPDVGPLRASLLAGGRSNLTYTLTDGARRWVLRRPPLGHVLATAHDMGREYRVMRALAPTPVPVPGMVFEHPEPDVLGAPFYVMERVDGVVYRDADDLGRLDADARRRLGHAFVDGLAALHLVDPASVGLADFGRPDGYLTRQVARWTKQLASSRSREVPGFDDLAARLAEDVPTTQRSSIVHGDYRLDNAIVDADDPGRVRAVLDWEMAALGDPLADLALFNLYWEGWGGMENPVAATPAEHGFPSSAELTRRYAERTGLDLGDDAWYTAFAHFKIAVILEGIHYRHVQGLTVGEGFDRIGALVPEIVRRGLAAIES
jgi:aminoglycoside phosphotransferase (APT) family kinase protein